MMITSQQLLETSIAQLQTLASFLSDQLSDSADDPGELETDACRQILRALDELIQDHQKTRAAVRVAPAHDVAAGDHEAMTSAKASPSPDVDALAFISV